MRRRKMEYYFRQISQNVSTHGRFHGAEDRIVLLALLAFFPSLIVFSYAKQGLGQKGG